MRQSKTNQRGMVCRRLFLRYLPVAPVFSWQALSSISAFHPFSGQGKIRIPKDFQSFYPHELSSREIRGKVCELLGVVVPNQQVPVQVGITENTEDGLQMIRLNFKNVLGEQVPAVLLMPEKKTSKTLPGIVCMSGTSGTADRLVEPRFGRDVGDKGPLRGWGRELARRGFVTLNLTLRGTVSRRTSLHHWERHIRFLIPYGLTMMGVMVDEALRASRILSARNEVDSNRVGMTGMSLGGVVTFYGMSCDESIRCGVPIAGSVGSLATLIHEGDVERHSSYIYIPHMLRYFDHPQIVANCICPRPFMTISPIRDEDMPRQGVEYMKDIVEEAYKMAGYPEHFKVYQPDSKHIFKRDYFEWMAQWFKRYC